jgi:hypothetical protein
LSVTALVIASLVYIPLGVVLARAGRIGASAVGVIAAWLRSRRRLAIAISQWFGQRIGWQELPRMRSTQFDQWCRRRDLRPGDVADQGFKHR